jgi:ankyrin repeat protein
MRKLKIILIVMLAIVTISCATTKQGQTSHASAKETEGLLEAAVSGDIDEVRKLVEAGVDANAADEWGVTALMVAASEGNSEIARLLIDQGADVDRICIHINAVTQVSINTAVKKLGKTRGSSVTTVFVPPENPDPTTALMVAAYDGHTEVARLLIDAGAQVDVAKSKGITALMIAAWRGHADYARLLGDGGAGVDLTDDSGGAALYDASCYGDLEIVSFLVAAGANVSVRTTEGDTSLMAATYLGNTEMARLLIGAGAEVNFRNKQGQTALVLASDSGNSDLVRLLKQAGAKE